MSLRKEVDFVTLKIKTGEFSKKQQKAIPKKNKKEEQEENSGSLKTDKIHR